jgi:hypothetical protein
VVQEAAAGNAHYASQRLQVLDDIEYVQANEISRKVTERLIEDGLLPPKAVLDAEHIAIAAAHSIRYLLTWNCKHLANPQIARNVVRACERLGFECPTICTPQDLMRTCAHA